MFIKCKLDKPYETQDESKIPLLAKISETYSIKRKLNCFMCCVQKNIEREEESDIQKERTDRRKTAWLSFTGDKDSIDIGNKLLSSRLILKGPGYLALTSTLKNFRIPIFLSDIQRFLTLPLLTPQRYDYFSTKWIDIVRRDEITRTVLIVVDGISSIDYKSYDKVLLNLTNAFHSCFEVITNTINEGSVIEELSIIPLIAADHENIVKTYGCIETAMTALTDTLTMLKTVFPITLENKSKDNKYNDVFPRNRLVLTASEMVDEGFPIPIPGKLKYKFSDYVMTKDKYLPLSPTSPLFSLSCERMDPNDAHSGLCRITLIDENYDLVYDDYVLPHNKMLRNRSVSEITMQMLLDMNTRIKEAHNKIKRIITPDSILVGDSLSDDLHSLKLMHPYVISTNYIFNITGSRRWKSKLKDVSLHYLDREIEGTQKDFSSKEHALASMELLHLKLAHNIQFGDKVLTRQQDKHILLENTAKRLSQKESSIRGVFDNNKPDTPVVAGSETTIKKYMDIISKKYVGKSECQRKIKMVPCSSNRSVISCMKRLMRDNFLIMGHLDYTGKNSLNIESVYQIDKWIRYIWNVCPSDTLLSVLFTGNSDHTGIYFINVKE